MMFSTYFHHILHMRSNIEQCNFLVSNCLFSKGPFLTHIVILAELSLVQVPPFTTYACTYITCIFGRMSFVETSFSNELKFIFVELPFVQMSFPLTFVYRQNVIYCQMAICRNVLFSLNFSFCQIVVTRSVLFSPNFVFLSDCRLSFCRYFVISTSSSRFFCILSESNNKVLTDD
jgi:hypothetical protein